MNKTQLRGRRGVVDAARTIRTAAVGAILAIALPMLSEASPKARMVGASTPGSARAARMLSTQQSVPALVGTVGGVELNTIVQLLNVLNREVDVELLFMASGEAAPALTLQQRLGRREMVLIDVGEALSTANRGRFANGFNGSVFGSSDQRFAILANMTAGGRGHFLGYQKKNGPSITGPIFSGALTSILQFVNFENTVVQLTSFLNNLFNEAVGNPLQTTLQPMGNETVDASTVFPLHGESDPSFLFNTVNNAPNAGANGVVVIDNVANEVFGAAGVFPAGGDQTISIPSIPGSEQAAIVRNNGTSTVDVLITAFNATGVVDSTTTETIAPNEASVVELGGPFVEEGFRLNHYTFKPRFRRQSAEDSISAVLIADQTPAGRVSTGSRVDGITPGNFHTLVPSWTEDYAANKRAVAMGATASDTVTVTFCVLNIGPKKARVKVVVRRSDGSRVFSKSVDVEPNGTVDVEFPKRAKGDLYADAKVSKGSVFTYFLEKHATGEINYIPGIAVK